MLETELRPEHKIRKTTYPTWIKINMLCIELVPACPSLVQIADADKVYALFHNPTTEEDLGVILNCLNDLATNCVQRERLQTEYVCTAGCILLSI